MLPCRRGYSDGRSWPSFHGRRGTLSGEGYPCPKESPHYWHLLLVFGVQCELYGRAAEERGHFLRESEALYEIKMAAPLHIAAAHLAATGASNRRIAQTLGKTEIWMSNLVRQPFFQERVVSILRERNRDALESMFKIQRFCNPAALVELRDGSKKPVVDTRMVRARDTLDRAFKKKEVTSPDPVAEGVSKEEV